MALPVYPHEPRPAGIVARPEDWPYSNYPDWVGLRHGTLLDARFIATWFGGPDEYRRFVDDVPSEATERAKIGRYALE